MFKIVLLSMLSAILLAQEVKTLWPGPPDEARFQFEKFIRGADDFRITKSFFRKVWDFLAGNEEKVLIKPYGLKVASDGKILVADSGAGAVFIFDPANNEMKTIEGFENQRLLSPIDVDTDEQGNLYVSDSVLGAVFTFDPKGELTGHIGQEQLHRPTGITIDQPNRRLYAVDTLRSIIEVFDLNGTHIRTIGSHGNGPGQFNRPTFVTLSPKGELYVSDTMNHRVQVLDREGKFIRSFGKLGDQIGDFGSIRGIAVDGEENVYVADTLFNALQIFDKEGQLLLVIGGHGEGRGQFAMPADVAITPEGDVYIADSYNMRLQHLKRFISQPRRES